MLEVEQGRRKGRGAAPGRVSGTLGKGSWVSFTTLLVSLRMIFGSNSPSLTDGNAAVQKSISVTT